MRRDAIIYLISLAASINDIGDPIETPTERKLMAKKDSAKRAEFYQAAATGLRPELTFTVWKWEYGGEDELKHEGKTYTVIRTYEPNDKEIELICSGSVNPNANA